MRRRLRLAPWPWCAVAALMLSGCKQEPAAEGGACKEPSDCAQGLQCQNGSCARPVVEAPPPPPPQAVPAPIQDAKQSGTTAQDGVDKRMKDILGE